MRTTVAILIVILIVAFMGCRFPDFDRTLPNDPVPHPMVAELVGLMGQEIMVQQQGTYRIGVMSMVNNTYIEITKPDGATELYHLNTGVVVTPINYSTPEITVNIPERSIGK